LLYGNGTKFTWLPYVSHTGKNDSAVPGVARAHLTILATNHCPEFVVLAAYRSTSYEFSRLHPGSRKVLLEVKTGSILCSPGSGARKEYVCSDTSVV
jgi:hypothetical protein